MAKKKKTALQKRQDKIKKSSSNTTKLSKKQIKQQQRAAKAKLEKEKAKVKKASEKAIKNKSKDITNLNKWVKSTKERASGFTLTSSKLAEKYNALIIRSKGNNRFITQQDYIKTVLESKQAKQAISEGVRTEEQIRKTARETWDKQYKDFKDTYGEDGNLSEDIFIEIDELRQAEMEQEWEEEYGAEPFDSADWNEVKKAMREYDMDSETAINFIIYLKAVAKRDNVNYHNYTDSERKELREKFGKGVK